MKITTENERRDRMELHETAIRIKEILNNRIGLRINNSAPTLLLFLFSFF